MNGRPWTPEEIDLLRERYADTPTVVLARELGRGLPGVYGMAKKQGLAKSETYRLSPHACRLRRGDNVGKEFRYLPGHVPANKGKRSPGVAPGRMAVTQFRKGGKPHTWMSIGSTRLSKEGYLQRKVTDTGYSPRDWVGEHILLWTEAHGPIPAAHCLKFKDGDKTHIALENLELITRRENMLRNSIHYNYPKELVQVVMLNGALKRKLRKHEKQDVGSAQSPVRDARSAEGREQPNGCSPSEGCE